MSTLRPLINRQLVNTTLYISLPLVSRHNVVRHTVIQPRDFRLSINQFSLIARCGRIEAPSLHVVSKHLGCLINEEAMAHVDVDDQLTLVFGGLGELSLSSYVLF